MNCADNFHDYIVQCPDGIKVNVVADAGAYSALRWQITDKFDNEYTGEVLTDGYGAFTIPVDELPAGLLTSYSGEFELKVLDVDNNCRPVPILVAGYYDSIVFHVKRGTKVKDNLGCFVECAGESEGSDTFQETQYGDGVTTVFETSQAFGSIEVHVGGLLLSPDQYSITGSNEITFDFAPEDGEAIQFEY